MKTFINTLLTVLCIACIGISFSEASNETMDENTFVQKFEQEPDSNRYVDLFERIHEAVEQLFLIIRVDEDGYYVVFLSFPDRILHIIDCNYFKKGVTAMVKLQTDTTDVAFTVADTDFDGNIEEGMLVYNNTEKVSKSSNPHVIFSANASITELKDQRYTSDPSSFQSSFEMALEELEKILPVRRDKRE